MQLKENTALLHIWSRIRDELALLQDRMSDDALGHVLNPIAGFSYLQNTSCAALVFAVEHIRSGETQWFSRSRMALDALMKSDIYSGLDEPKWDRLGWHYNRGSLFTTGTLLDTFWKASDTLGIYLAGDDQDITRLLNYLETCMIKMGLFTHDSIAHGQRPSAVQNVNAIAFYILEMIAARQVNLKCTLLDKRDLVWSFLRKGQRPDGFWPYIYPGIGQQIVFRYTILRLFAGYTPKLRRYFIKPGDNSIFFGDAVHHCLVLYYILKSIYLRRANFQWAQVVSKGWSWIREHLVATDDGALRFDFSWEPMPSRFRYCNFRDTSTYFLILAMLPLLAGLGVEENGHKISAGLLLHIERSLLQGKAAITSIKPYESSDDVLRWILPRVGEASAWKGALLAEFVLSKIQQKSTIKAV